MWHRRTIYTFPALCFARKPFAWFSVQEVSCATFHLFAKSWTLILRQYMSMQLHIHTLATVYSFLASFRESLKPEEQIQMFLSLASSIQNSRWQNFIWKCTRLTQHLLLPTITFYDQRFWSLPPVLSRKNTTKSCMGSGSPSWERNIWFASGGM